MYRNIGVAAVATNITFTRVHLHQCLVFPKPSFTKGGFMGWVKNKITGKGFCIIASLCFFCLICFSPKAYFNPFYVQAQQSYGSCTSVKVKKNRTVIIV